MTILKLGKDKTKHTPRDDNRKMESDCSSMLLINCVAFKTVFSSKLESKSSIIARTYASRRESNDKERKHGQATRTG